MSSERSLKQLPSVCVPFLPLSRLTGVLWSCLGLRGGLWFLCRWESGLWERGAQPGILPRAPGLPFGTSRLGLVGGREAISRDTEVRDELDEELVPFRGDGTAGGGAPGEVSGGPCHLCPGLAVPASRLSRTCSPLDRWTGPGAVPGPSQVSCLVPY